MSDTIRVIIQQPALPKYRIPVFRTLAQRTGIQLQLLYGDTPGLPNAAPDGFDARHVPIRYLPADLMWHRAQFAHAGLRKNDVLVLSWNLRYANLVPSLLMAKARRIRTVLWGHGYSKHDARWRSSLRRRITALADATLFYSHSAARASVLHGLPPEKAFVALNALDQAPIQSARHAWLARPEDLLSFQQSHGLARGPVFLFVSRLEASNRIDLLVHALKLLQPQFPQAKAIVIGKGPEMEPLRSLAASLGISDNVLFPGAIYDEQQLAPYFLSSTAFCYPSNIGLSILHAFGYGLPVVTSDKTQAQNPEIEALIDGRNGLLYRDGDVASLAAQLARLATNPQLHQDLSDNARLTATRDFSLANMVDGMEAAIRYAAATKPSSSLPRAPGGLPSPRPRRLAIIANANAPYRQHQHLRIAREMPEVELHSLFTHDISNAPWTLKAPPEIRPVLFGRGESAEHQARFLSALHEYRKGGRVIRWLKSNAIDVVLCLGYNDPGRARLINWCHRHRLPIVLWGDSSIRGDRARGLRRWLKRRIVPPLLAKCSVVLACGAFGKQYFTRYGVPADKLGILALEPDYSLVTDLPQTVLDEVAHQYSIDRSRRRLIYSGRLVSEKRVDLLIAAFSAIAPERPDWDLLIVGNGPLRTELGAMVPANLKHRVVWPGFLGDQRYVSAMYRLSDVLVLPSEYEPWALVINEAAAAGLAIVASDVVGAAAELVSDHVNGRIFPAGDLAALETALLDVTDPTHTQHMQAASIQVLHDWRTKADPIVDLRSALRACGIPTP